MTAEIDLKQLVVEKKSATAANAVRHRAVISRYVLPGVIIAGFLGMLIWAFSEQLLPATSVTVVPVVMQRAEAHQAGTPLFQSAGWVEPRPTAVMVSALAEGVIEQLLVVEGQDVKAGDPLARLLDVDAKLALEQAQAALALRESELASSQAELESAQLTLENPVHLDAALADAESLLAKTETELAKLPFLVESAAAKLEFSQKNYEGKVEVSDAIAGRSLQQAKSDLNAARAELEELKGRGPKLEHEAKALKRRTDALARQRELLIAENRQVAMATSAVASATARVKQAKLEIDAAKLTVERMVVKSPITGRVLALIAKPGTRVMGLAAASEQNASDIVSLYDPNMLQVRADVRLDDVPLVQIGQPVQISTASVKEPMTGRLLASTSQANVQKNTLEVKVAIDSPPANLRPEMLVAATFLAPEMPKSATQIQEAPQRLMVSRQLVETSGDTHTVWVADPSGVARRASLQLGTAGTEELIEVVTGLSPGDRIISGGREGLSEGERIKISGDDATIGISQK